MTDGGGNWGPTVFALFGFSLCFTVCAVLTSAGQRRVKLQYYHFGLAPTAGAGRLTTEVEPYIPFNINPTGMQPLLATTILMSLPGFFARIYKNKFWISLKDAFTPGASNPICYYTITVCFIFLFNILDLGNIPVEVNQYLMKIGARIPGIKPGHQNFGIFDKSASFNKILGRFLVEPSRYCFHARRQSVSPSSSWRFYRVYLNADYYYLERMVVEQCLVSRILEHKDMNSKLVARLVASYSGIADNSKDEEKFQRLVDAKWKGAQRRDCSAVVHKPPPTAIPQMDIAPARLLTEKAKSSAFALMNDNSKSSSLPATQALKAKDKGKALMTGAKKVDPNGWQQPKKVFTPKTRPLQSRNWSASAPMPGQTSVDTSPASRLWTGVLKKGLPMMESDDMDVAHAQAHADEHEDMA
ncbi:hypothetical protein L7F22_060113 [Adiantum nelumboides]|nr:hypothetical protein [Adiantum nelumboides]